MCSARSAFRPCGAGLFVTGALSQKEWLEIAARPGFWRIFSLVYMWVAVAWYFLLVPMGVSAAQRLRLLPAVIVGTLTVAILLFVMIIFIR